ncbi:hypothetical protein GUJ93_ZPchr0014g46995 [Zizania palustris]|uniref:Uncharacterized protein n=1 Tax=Zizania palustris TaxID=103762 RepID=A0A8J5W6Q1_ZIZPA|nr:hypothetical protein GUJ93_ZPchr0014g46995 [Zizania palustris]
MVSGGAAAVPAAPGATSWLRGRVKAVPSGDTVVIMGTSKSEIPPEMSVTLSAIIAPRLARRAGIDEPFAWQSREFLRTFLIGQDVTFRVEYSHPSSGREFGSIYIGEKNVAFLIVAAGFAKVKDQGQKGELNPYVTELLRLENIAKNQALGLWNKELGAAEESIRDLPLSVIGEASGFDAKGFVAENKGKSLEAIVEQVRDGSTIRVYLIPSFLFVQVYVAGVQAPSMGRRASIPTTVAQSDVSGSGESLARMTAAQRLVASADIYSEIPPDRFGREAKHFTETLVLNREVRIVLEGTDSFNNIFGSVYYPDGDGVKDLALELVQNGFARYIEWSANMLDLQLKIKLRNADGQAKKDQLKIWAGYKPPVTNTKPIHNKKITGKVIEVVNGFCIIVADDAEPYDSPSAECRVNLASIRLPKLQKSSEHFARAAKEFLRTRLIGKQVNVSMEYSRRINANSDGQASGPKTNSAAEVRVLEYGSVFLPPQVEGEVVAPTACSNNQLGINVAELLLSRGFADITKHWDYEERSHYYDDLMIAHARAEKAKKGYHSKKEFPVSHMTDLTAYPAKKAKEFLHLFQRGKKYSATVDYVFSGHRFKLTIPKETCTIAFSFSGVRCPGKNEPYSNEAIALMRRRILQRDVEIEIETVDRTGTFLGSLWESNSKINVASTLLEAGLASFSSFVLDNGLDKIPDGQVLIRAEKLAKQKKLKLWENYKEPEVVCITQTHKETLKVVVTEVLGGGMFYVQSVDDDRVISIQKKLASLDVKDPPATLEVNDPSETQEIKDPSEILEVNDPSETHEVKDPSETHEVKDPSETQEVKDTSETQLASLDVKDPESQEVKHPSETQVKDPSETEEAKDQLETLKHEDSSYTFVVKDLPETLDVEDPSETLEPKDSLDVKDPASQEGKHPSETQVKDPSETEEAEDQLETLKHEDSSDTFAVKDLPETLDAEDPSEDLEAKDEPATFKDKDLPETLDVEDRLDIPVVQVPQSNAAPFTPLKGDMVLARFSLDDSWNRAMIVSQRQGAEEPEFDVFYLDYGNQEVVPYSRLRSIDPSISSVPPLARLCRLAFVKVPDLSEYLGRQAAMYLSTILLASKKEFEATVEERDALGGKLRGQGTGEILSVTLLDEESDNSINAEMLEVCN